MIITGSLDKQWFNRYNINTSRMCIHSAIKLLVYIWESIAFIKKHICKCICFVWELLHSSFHETRRRRWKYQIKHLTVGEKKMYFPGFLWEMQLVFQTFTYFLLWVAWRMQKLQSAQVQPWKMASDRESLWQGMGLLQSAQHLSLKQWQSPKML